MLALESKVAANIVRAALSKTSGEPTAVESLEVATTPNVPLLFTTTGLPPVIAPDATA